jgi:2-hydroxychromene-2-carboxylate isomerase
MGRSNLRKLEFWYEFASPYSYLSAMRIEGLAHAAGVDVVWRPFLLGPIFSAQGWKTSPFNLFPARGRHMVRDMQRRSAMRGLAFSMPKQFPANSLQAARLAMIGEAEGWVAPFSKAVFDAEFVRGKDVADIETLSGILSGLGVHPEPRIAALEDQMLKDQLRQRTVAAQEMQIFGAPTFVVDDGELFWGDDRLEDALAWSRSTGEAHVAR